MLRRLWQRGMIGLAGSPTAKRRIGENPRNGVLLARSLLG
jgi:hypothetical protein